MSKKKKKPTPPPPAPYEGHIEVNPTDNGTINVVFHRPGASMLMVLDRSAAEQFATVMDEQLTIAENPPEVVDAEIVEDGE